MELKNIIHDNNVASDKATRSFKRAYRKLTSSQTVYAGLLLFLVPSVICEPAWPTRLTYEQIYNSTNYAQIQPYTPVSYNPHSHSYNHRYREENYGNIEETNHKHSGETNNRYSGNTKHKYSEETNNKYRVETNNRHVGGTKFGEKTNNRLNEKTKLRNSDISEETKVNEVGDERDYLDEKRSTLLVGFARDPFRYSIPEEDYRNGVRSINPQSYRNENRGKRGVLHLYNMLTCANGCDPLSYKGYGCYCGFLGEGRPTDGIDRCCQMHDKCYEDIYCPLYTVYFQPYYWKCWHGEPLCALENYHTQGQLVNGCAGRLCECDRQFAMCVKRYSCPRGRALCRSSPLRLLQNILMFR